MEGEKEGKGREGEGREGGLCSSNISFKKALAIRLEKNYNIFFKKIQNCSRISSI